MRVVEPHSFKEVKHPKSKKKPHLIRLGILAFVVVYIVGMYGRPLPTAVATSLPVNESQKQDVQLAWPAYGQAAVGAVGYGVLETHGEQKALPTASVAKVMTALAVLKQKPLKIGEQGPVITITQSDVDEYARTVAMDGSNVPVALGEQITQYEALQALLLPSANNMAHTLVRWAYGSEDDYLQFVNNFAKSLGMKNTNFDDPSGYSPKTVSTSEDLVKLAVNAMDNPVIAEIAAQKEATIPVAGRIYNVNALLGRDGIAGIKTGNTEEAGGCFMAAAVREINGQKVTVVSVIMGAPTLFNALKDSVPLTKSTFDGFSEVTVATAGQEVGIYEIPWGDDVPLLAKNDLKAVAWQNTAIKTDLIIQNSTIPIAAGETVGVLKAEVGRNVAESPVVTSTSISAPTIFWRLTPRM